MQSRRNFTCGKCGLEPDEWERTAENPLSDFKCPRCGKPHFHFKTGTVSGLIPIDEEEEEIQHVFITCTGRKIWSVEKAKYYLSNTKEKKKCKNCGNIKSENWRYSQNKQFDLVCPECGKRHLEDTKKLIPVDENGKRQNVMMDSDGNTYVGEEEIQERIQELETGQEGGDE